MGIRIEGVDRLQRAITDATGRIDQETVKVLRQAAVRVRRRQKDLAPTDEGDLRKSITFNIRGRRWRRTAEIGPKLGEMYPVFQEYGTARMSANPYVGPSLDGELDRLAGDLDGIVDRSFR